MIAYQPIPARVRRRRIIGMFLGVAIFAGAVAGLLFLVMGG